MEQQNSSYDSVCNQLLPLSSKYPWFVADNLIGNNDGSSDHFFYTLNDTVSKYECRISELRQRHIRGYYHGWVILTQHPQDVVWSIWNPVTSKMIDLPPLILKDGDSESIRQCCLSAPPEDPNSYLLLTRFDKPTFVIFPLASKKNKQRWIEVSYSKQLKRITGEDKLFIYNLACCNGKLYALNTFGSFGIFFIQLDIILFKDKEVKVKLLLLGMTPFPLWNHCTRMAYFLKGYCTELFCIIVGFSDKRVEGVYSYKLDMTSVKPAEMNRFKDVDMSCKRWNDLGDWKDLLESMKMWEALVDLKEAIFFVDLCLHLVYYRPAIALELGGHIHIRHQEGKILYSYNVKDNTISLSTTHSLVLPTSVVSLWECRLEDDHGGAKCVDSKHEKDQIAVRSVRDNEIGLNESNFLNLTFDMFKMIMEHCVGVEYMNFRATCKQCHVAVPSIQWSNESSLSRLRTYSLVSPWLMVVEKNQGVISFTDPMSGEVYYIKYQQLSIADDKIWCCMYGWLLFESCDLECLVFFNPFTNDLRKLPKVDYTFISVCFSAPPTSHDCMVVGYPAGDESQVLIHYVAREPSWHTLRVGGKPCIIRFPTFIGRDFFALHGEGQLMGFKDLGEEGFSSAFMEAKAAINCSGSPAKYYLMKRDQDLLLVTVSKFGEHVEVFKKNNSKQKWKKIKSLGNHIIYICRTTCLCIEAKTPEMENKIYFPLLHSKNRKILFYSLDTLMFDTFNGGSIQQQFKDFLGATYHLFPEAWIEPNWGS